jgi:hypothetical protein
MDRANAIVLIILVLLVAAAAWFYTNTGENHRTVSIGLCELICQNITSGNYNGSSFCAARNISGYGYSCAISSSVNSSLCNVSPTVYVNKNCNLVSVG